MEIDLAELMLEVNALANADAMFTSASAVHRNGTIHEIVIDAIRCEDPPL